MMEINLEKEFFADGDKAFQKSLKKNMKVNHRPDKALESMTHPVANISAELSPEVGSIPTGHKKESYLRFTPIKQGPDGYSLDDCNVNSQRSLQRMRQRVACLRHA